MKELPAELTIIPEDTTGVYSDGCDCTIARALKRTGVIMDGYCVGPFGQVIGPDHKIVGRYKWKDIEFYHANADHIGTLVLAEAPVLPPMKSAREETECRLYWRQGNGSGHLRMG